MVLCHRKEGPSKGVLVRILFLAFFWTCLVLNARAKADFVADVVGCQSDPCVIIDNPGGGLARFEEAAEAIRQGARTRIIVAGWCASACTVLLDWVREKVCLSPQAVLGFHRGTRFQLEYADQGARFPYVIAREHFDIEYSPPIKKWIEEQGGLPENGDVVLMALSTALTIWSPCEWPKSRSPASVRKTFTPPHSIFDAHSLY